MILRDYQKEAVDAVYSHLRHVNDNPCVVIPTGGGKTPILATICRDVVKKWNGRVLVLAHVKELLLQTVEKLSIICPDIPVGVYSAGLNRKELGYSIIVASIQSIYKKACEAGAFDLIIVDEAHLIQPAGEGRYMSFLKEAKIVCPHVRVIGLTATPYRMKSGTICTGTNILNSICYEINIKPLIDLGYLSPMISKAAIDKIDTTGVKIVRGEFDDKAVDELVNTTKAINSACKEITDQCYTRQSCLIFAHSIDHGEKVAAILRKRYGVTAETIFGHTLPHIRQDVIEKFKSGKLKYLINMNVLTVGFDAPNVDCVVLLRPTMSPGLYYQMVGRGFRVAEGKKDCLVLDFGGNVLQHGPVDNILLRDPATKSIREESPAKECPRCQRLIAPGFKICPGCDYVFPEKSLEDAHDSAASLLPVLSETTYMDYDVTNTSYYQHTKKGGSSTDPKTLRVEYQTGFNDYQSEWVCFEHTGFARSKAEMWWSRRSRERIPSNVNEALSMIENGAVANPISITVKETSGEKFVRITRCILGPVPEYQGYGGEPGDDPAEENETWKTELSQVGGEDDIPF